MTTIQMAGREVSVDDGDLHLFLGYEWSFRKSGFTEYLQKSIYVDGKYVGVRSLHRFITGCPDGMVVDHINGNGLDNRRENLRVCTQSENLRNRKMHQNNASGFKGVFFDPAPRSKPWRSRITVSGKRFNIGRFDTPEEAYAAYCKASLEKHGEFSRVV